MTANLTQRHCVDATGNTRRPIPTQESGQFFEKRRALQWRRRTRMDSSIHPCSRIWTVLGQGRPHLIGRRAGGCEHPSLLKNLDSSEWGHSYLGDRRAGCFQQPSLLKNSDGEHPYSRNRIAKLKSTPLCDIALLPSPARTHCCSSRRRGPYRYVFTHARIPAQEFDSRYPRNL